MDSIYAAALGDGDDFKDGKEDEEDLPPLRAESIYNMALVARPTTAIVTYGEPVDPEEERRHAIDSFIREEDDSREEDSWQQNHSSANGHADVWVAGNSSDDDSACDRQPDSPTTHVRNSFAAASSAGVLALYPGHLTQLNRSNSPQITPTPTGVGSLDQLAEDSYALYTSAGLEENEAIDEKPTAVRDAPISGAVDCRKFIQSSFASSQGQHAHLALNSHRYEGWLSSGLFPQYFVLTFAHPIKLDAIDLDVAGCSKLMLELHVDGHQVDLENLLPDGSRGSQRVDLVGRQRVTSSVRLRAMGAQPRPFFAIYNFVVWGTPLIVDDHW